MVLARDSQDCTLFQAENARERETGGVKAPMFRPNRDYFPLWRYGAGFIYA